MDLTPASGRRAALTLGGLLFGGLLGGLHGVGRASAAASAAGDGGNRLWFDPTQLPSFTGVVERYLMDPDGNVSRLLFQEGPQVLFPADVGTAVQAAIKPGEGIVAWGIRARRAPVITMLAWARSADAAPNFVDRPIWGFGDFELTGNMMQVSGDIVAPLYNPQGDAIGAILPDGVVVRVPRGVGLALGDKLSAGRRLVAAGRGREGPLGRALDAERIGDTPESLAPLPPPSGARP